jgi:tetratricopeptide (TPR) repeat protein
VQCPWHRLVLQEEDPDNLEKPRGVVLNPDDLRVHVEFTFSGVGKDVPEVLEAPQVDEQKYLVAMQLKQLVTIQPTAPAQWMTFPLKSLHAGQPLSKDREWFNEVTSEECVFESKPAPPPKVPVENPPPDELDEEADAVVVPSEDIPQGEACVMVGCNVRVTLKLSAAVTVLREKVFIEDGGVQDVSSLIAPVADDQHHHAHHEPVPVAAPKPKKEYLLKISLEGSISILPRLASVYSPVTFNYIAHLHALNGRYQAAIQFHTKALAQQELNLAAKTPYKLAIHAGDLETAQTMYRLGRVHCLLAQSGAAMHWFQRSKAVQHSILGKAPHGRNARVQKWISIIYKHVGKYDEAEKYCHQALTIVQAIHGGDSVNCVNIVHEICTVLSEQGNVDDAVLTLDAQAHKPLEDKYGKGAVELIPSLLLLGHILATAQMTEKAATQVERIEAIMEANGLDSYPHIREPYDKALHPKAYLNHKYSLLRASVLDLKARIACSVCWLCTASFAASFAASCAASCATSCATSCAASCAASHAAY